jgi:predicted alpha/beta-hydrolase family hydrolase
MDGPDRDHATLLFAPGAGALMESNRMTAITHALFGGLSRLMSHILLIIKLLI